MSGNNLMTIPDDFFNLKLLEDLNLSSNLFTSASALVNPAVIVKSIGQMPKLKRLNLSRNKFQAFHSDLLDKDADFPQLQELDVGFNMIQD